MANEDDIFVETTTSSWGSRLGGSIGGVVVGLILFIASFFLLFWNEGRAVDAALALDAGAKAVISVQADAVNPANDGKLIHLSGRAAPSGRLEDPTFRVGAAGLLRLERKVEMFQWREHADSKSEKSVGGSETTTTTYRYTQEWADAPVDSSAFKKRAGHENPQMRYRSATFDAEGAKLGAFLLAKTQLQKLNDFVAFIPKADGAAALPQGFRWVGDNLYRGETPDAPAVGDMRVSFRVVEAQTISVVAAQSGGGLTAFHGRDDYKVELAQLGLHTADAMFKAAKDEENLLTWILRGVGFLMMLIGVMLIAGPLSWLASLIPFLESLVDAAVGFVALMIAAPLTLFTIAAAWLAHRPLLAGGMIVAGLIVTVAVRKFAPHRAASPLSAPSSR